jgi:hypothetical protein
MFLGVIMITSKSEDDQYTPLSTSEESPAVPNQLWNEYHQWNRENDNLWNPPVSSTIAPPIPSDPIPTGVEAVTMPSASFSPSRYPSTSPSRPRPLSTPGKTGGPFRRASTDIHDDTALRRLSGILTSVGSSVGTHGIRKMEFDHISDLAHAAASFTSKSPRHPNLNGPFQMDD